MTLPQSYPSPHGARPTATTWTTATHQERHRQPTRGPLTLLQSYPSPHRALPKATTRTTAKHRERHRQPPRGPLTLPQSYPSPRGARTTSDDSDDYHTSRTTSGAHTGPFDASAVVPEPARGTPQGSDSDDYHTSRTTSVAHTGPIDASAVVPESARGPPLSDDSDGSHPPIHQHSVSRRRFHTWPLPRIDSVNTGQHEHGAGAPGGPALSPSVASGFAQVATPGQRLEQRPSFRQKGHRPRRGRSSGDSCIRDSGPGAKPCNVDNASWTRSKATSILAARDTFVPSHHINGL